MKLFALLHREWLGARRNALLVVLLLILPVSLGLFFGTFKNIMPKGTPSIIVPEEGASDADVKFAKEITAFFSTPVAASQVDEKKLFREEAYFILTVPQGLREGKGNVKVYVDASFTPVVDLAPVVVGSIKDGMRSWGVTGIDISVEEVGKPVVPFQFFVPGLLVLLSAAVGLVVVPYSTAKDARVMQRVLESVSPAQVVAGKLVFALALVMVQIALFLLTQKLAGVPGESLFTLSAWSVAAIGLSAIGFTATGLLVSFATRFSEAGKQLDALLFGFAVVFSGMFYPVGFFPSLPGLGNALQDIARATPGYYSVILLRCLGVKGTGIEAVGDYAVITAVFALVATGACWLALKRLKHE